METQKFAIRTTASGRGKILAALISDVPPAWRENRTRIMAPRDYGVGELTNHQRAAVDLALSIQNALPALFRVRCIGTVAVVGASGRPRPADDHLHMFAVIERQDPCMICGVPGCPGTCID